MVSAPKEEALRTGICPKCGSQQVYSGKRPVRPDACPGVTMALSARANFLPDYASVTNYICAVCGYAESYISDPNALREVARSWDRVYPTAYR